MRKIFLASLIPLFVMQPEDIYHFTVTKLGGGIIDFNNYQGKRIMLVNIASHSNRSGQLQELEQLYQQHINDLVIIAFPSNNFNHEPHADSVLQAEMINISFPISIPVNVTDSPYARHPVFEWLATKTANGVMNAKVGGDFYKFLLNKQGRIVAFFDSSTSPISPVVQTALQLHQ